jgi:hypothetical protein
VHAPPSPESLSFEYAIVRVVPRVERGEFINVGLIVFCMVRKTLLSRIHIEETKLQALRGDIDLKTVREHLEAFPRICNGEPDAGPIARLSERERFHWLVSPRSTMIQISPVHSGLCVSPEEALNDLFKRLVQ